MVCFLTFFGVVFGRGGVGFLLASALAGAKAEVEKLTTSIGFYGVICLCALCARIAKIQGAEQSSIQKYFTILKKKDAIVLNTVKIAGSKEDQIETAFMSILNRKPDSKETRAIKDALQKSGDNFYKDVVWVLINSHEFLFVQ